MKPNNVLKTIGFLKYKTITYKGLLVITGSLILVVLLFSTCAGMLPETYAPVLLAGTITRKPPVTQVNVIADTATTALERLVSTSKKTISHLNVNDTISAHYLKSMYAYQIDSAFTNEQDALTAFGKLYDVKDVYLVKAPCNKYYLLNYDGKTKQKLIDFLQYFKSLTPGQITVVNLTDLCPTQKALLVAGPINTKNKPLHCLTCK